MKQTHSSCAGRSWRTVPAAYRRAAAACALLTVVGSPAIAQCAPAWTSIGADSNVTCSLTLADGSVVVGGTFDTIGGVTCHKIARWDGATWSPLGSGMTHLQGTGSVLSLVQLANGDIVAGGVFSSAGGVNCLNIAQWNGSSWSPLGSGVGSLGQSVACLVVTPSGLLLAGGNFTSAGGHSASDFAMWTGSAWVANVAGLGNSISDYVLDMTVLPSGEVVAVGVFGSGGSLQNVALWNPQSWTWSAMGAGVAGIPAGVIQRPNGDLVVGGQVRRVGTSSLDGVLRWDGTNWVTFVPVPPMLVSSISTLPNGDLIIGQESGVPAYGVSRFDGTNWVSLATTDHHVRSLTQMRNGDMLVGGSFTTLNGSSAPRLARLSSTCAPTVTSTPTACQALAGPITSTPLSHPWCGSNFVIEGSGFLPSPVGLVASIVGFTTTNQPLSVFSPAAGPGCALLVTPDSTLYLFPQGTTVTTSIAIPNSLAFVGLTMHQQFLHTVTDPSNGNVLALDGGNALAFTVGAY